MVCPDDTRRPDAIQIVQKPPICPRSSKLTIPSRYKVPLKSDLSLATQVPHAGIIDREGLNSKLFVLKIG